MFGDITYFTFGEEVPKSPSFLDEAQLCAAQVVQGTRPPTSAAEQSSSWTFLWLTFSLPDLEFWWTTLFSQVCCVGIIFPFPNFAFNGVLWKIQGSYLLFFVSDCCGELLSLHAVLWQILLLWGVGLVLILGAFRTQAGNKLEKWPRGMNEYLSSRCLGAWMWTLIKMSWWHESLSF